MARRAGKAPRKALIHGYEPSDVHVGRIAWVGPGLAFVVLVFGAGIWAMIKVFQGLQPPERATTIERSSAPVPPPQLQANPQAALEALRKHESRILTARMGRARPGNRPDPDRPGDGPSRRARLAAVRSVRRPGTTSAIERPCCLSSPCSSRRSWHRQEHGRKRLWIRSSAAGSSSGRARPCRGTRRSLTTGDFPSALATTSAVKPVLLAPVYYTCPNLCGSRCRGCSQG